MDKEKKITYVLELTEEEARALHGAGNIIAMEVLPNHAQEIGIPPRHIANMISAFKKIFDQYHANSLCVDEDCPLDKDRQAVHERRVALEAREQEQDREFNDSLRSFQEFIKGQLGGQKQPHGRGTLIRGEDVPHEC